MTRCVYKTNVTATALYCVDKEIYKSMCDTCATNQSSCMYLWMLMYFRLSRYPLYPKLLFILYICLLLPSWSFFLCHPTILHRDHPTAISMVFWAWASHIVILNVRAISSFKGLILRYSHSWSFTQLMLQSKSSWLSSIRMMHIIPPCHLSSYPK